ncbi:MAG: FecR domain-containing protein [Abitibacteriaceae bacterium]|nr:FecR domain-containing protein [Abditibacteriaceae bacterium]
MPTSNLRWYAVVRAVVLLGLIPFTRMHPACAQVARLGPVQHITEKKMGNDAAWQSAATGAALNVNDRLRTGKRSKADVRFTDGSLLRLGQLSSIEVRSAKGVALTGGQLMFAMLKPGRVLAGSATAEIKGSVGLITVKDDGTSDFSLFSGAMDVTSVQGTTSLRPGQSVSVRTDGTLSAIRATLPFFFADGTSDPDMLEPPSNAPHVGSPTNIRERQQPARTAINTSTTTSITQSMGPLVPFGISPAGRPNPFPTPFPTVPPPVDSRASIAGSALPRRSQVAEAPNLPLANPPGTTADANAVDLGAAYAHMGQVDPSLGSGDEGDVRVIGVLGDAGRYGIGGRIYGAGSQGHWFTEAEFTPLRVRTAAGDIRDLSTISNANITYRLRRTIIKAGRQRFLAGPTQAAILGSMVRQGGREVMDAMSITEIMGKGRLQVAYLYDAFPNNLPFRVPGLQKGWYGRYSLQEKAGNFGLNVLNYEKAPISSGTGITGDFAVSLVPKQIEFYGELGRDPYKRRLTTLGLSFPGLYDRTDFDVYVEYAKVRGSSVAADLPPELAILVYRRLNPYMNLLLAMNKFSNTTRLTVGLSAGAKLSE